MRCLVAVSFPTLLLVYACGVARGDETWRLHVGPGGARYTPFEWLSDEDETTTATQTSSPAGAPAPQAGAVETRRSMRRTKFRIRTETVHPQPSVVDALHAYRPVCAGGRAAAEDVRKKLSAPCDGFDFLETPLSDVVVHLREAVGIPLRLDVRALDEAGLDPATPITGRVQGVPLGAALRTLLDGLDMDYVIRDDMLVLTTRAAAEQTPAVASYPIPLTDDGAALVRLVTTAVAPETWSVMGGFGTIEIDACATRLVVSQTERVHDEITALLASLHGIRDRGGAEAGRPSPFAHTVYVVPHVAVREHLAEQLVALCNDALGEAGDEAASVALVDDRVVVRSEVFAFQCYAAQVVRSLVGIEVSTVEKVTVGPAGMAW